MTVCLAALLIAALWGAGIAAGEPSDAPHSLQVVSGAEPPVIATLSWQEPATGAPELYHVYVGWSLTGPYHLKGRTQDTSWTFSNGMTGTSYYFRVVAVNADGAESAATTADPIIATWSRSPHSDTTAYSTRCAECHSTHEAGETLIRLELVSDTVGSSCLVCHDGRNSQGANIASGTVDSFALPSGHKTGTPSAGRMEIANCATCHDTHGISSVSRMIPAEKINNVVVSKTGNDVCLSCHNTTDDWFGAGYPSTTAPVRNSAGYPVSGRWTGPATYNSATNPHRNIPETTQTVSATDPVRREKGDCLYCHAAHRGPNQYDALKANYDVVTASTLASDKAQGTASALCFGCHGGTTPSGFTTAPVNIRQFSTGTTATAGHSIVTAGGTLPVGASLPCFECHNPHGSKRGNSKTLSDSLGTNLRTDTALDVRHFCFTCHTTSNTRTGWDSVQGIYVRPAATATVVGILRSGGVLRLPVTQGAHNENNTQSCNDCHGNSYAAGGNNVHSPSRMVPAAAAAMAPADTTLAEGFTIDPMLEAPVESDVVAPITIADTSEAASGIVRLAASDSGSGVASTFYAVDGAQAVEGAQVLVEAEGTHSLEFWSVDVAGNVEARSTIEFTVDRTAPVTTSDAIASYDESATITFTATDTVSSTETWFTLDGSAETTGTTVSTNVDGAHALWFWSVDSAGNAEVGQLVEFTVVGGVAAPIPPTTETTQPALEPTILSGFGDWLLNLL